MVKHWYDNICLNTEVIIKLRVLILSHVNIDENLWDEFKRLPTELEVPYEQEWAKIPPKRTESLLANCKKLLQAVIFAKGGDANLLTMQGAQTFKFGPCFFLLVILKL